MNIFCDFHHSGLWDSLEFLFEKRLGYKLYRPMGLEWFPDWWGIGKPYGDLGHLTATQYLTIKDPPDPKGITLEQFKNMPIDIVIASVPQNIEPYKKLVAQYHPEAKFVFQMGNMFNEVLSNLHDIPNLLSSTISFPVPNTCNAVFYHQEFDLNIFKPHNLILKPENKMVSFVNCLPQTGHIGKFMEMKQLYHDCDIKMYGASCDDGIIGTTQEIANIMNTCRFGIHLKWGGDGFGHILFNWYACGKPVITSFSDYKGKLGEELLTDMETAIDIDKRSVYDVIEITRNMKPLQYEYMCQQAYQRFKDCVDYDKEEVKIREWLKNLK